jgi:predicted dehydrogenase
VRVDGDEKEKQMAATAIAPPFDDSISELRAVIRQGAKPDGLSSLETNVIVTEILDAARRSATTGTTVRLASDR